MIPTLHFYVFQIVYIFLCITFMKENIFYKMTIIYILSVDCTETSMSLLSELYSGGQSCLFKYFKVPLNT